MGETRRKRTRYTDRWDALGSHDGRGTADGRRLQATTSTNVGKLRTVSSMIQRNVTTYIRRLTSRALDTLVAKLPRA